MEPLNKGHIEDDNSVILSFVERLSSFRCSQSIATVKSVVLVASRSVLCREVY